MRANAKSSAKQHAEWLSLIDVSGPFLTLTVLNASLSVGLDAHDADLYRGVKEAYEEWEDNPSPAIHTAWIRFLLSNLLGYPSECIGEAQSIPESAVADLELQGQRIRPDLAILDPDAQNKVRIPILIYPRNQKLDSPISGSSWAASPHTRMQILLQNTGLQAGYVTNGAQWSLVHVRKGEPTGFATWQTMLLTEEKLLLQAFVGILGVERTLGSPDGESLFDLLDKSSQDQEEVTKELGRQVRQAVEVFVNALDRLDQDSGRTLLSEADPQTVYNAALTVMMRLIFLLCAEERDLMDSRNLYVQNYSVSELNDQLRASASGDEQVLEHRRDAWNRLLATFRLVHGGCNHEDLNLPAYGGSLFDPAKYPFLESAQIDNRVTLHLLDALEFLEIRLPGGRERRRLSFRALGVEQIGHVYEGLLDHTAIRATEPVVGLTGKETEEEEIALSVLEANRTSIGDYFTKNKIKVAGNPDRLLTQAPDSLAVSKLRVACGSDVELFARVFPFLNIVREDSLEHTQVYPSGSLFVTAGTDRRASGTHYTPVSLTEELVRYALEPQVYVGPAEGLPRNEWKLKTAKELVDLKVCDIAMGSGAFLVQTCRYLSARLVEAWQTSIDAANRSLGFSTEGAYFTHLLPEDHWKKGVGATITTPIGNIAIADPSQELISENPEERLSQARRIIADRCLYGVDINPMAVEMAKLSLWLTTMQRERPFTFLDHALRVGDSLLGVSEKQLRAMTMRPDDESGNLMFHWVPKRMEEVREIRKQLARIPSHDPDSVRKKAQITLQAEIKSRWLQEAADILMLSELRRIAKRPMEEKEWDRLMAILKEGPYKLPDEVADLRAAQKSLNRTTFNWELAYPEIFEQGGFDAIVGNPPFLGASKVSGTFGADYRLFVTKHIGMGRPGIADLSVYFLLRALRLGKPSGCVALITTSSISEGDSREVGLENLREYDASIIRAEKNRSWPGAASVTFATLVIKRGDWRGFYFLEHRSVAAITSSLADGNGSEARPEKLRLNQGLAYIGTYILGTGFTLDPAVAQQLIQSNEKYSEVLSPFLTGGDMNDSPTHEASRWIINFRDWPLSPIESQVASLHFASDFPDLLAIVRRDVKPLRETSNRKVYREKWWHFGERRVELYEKLKERQEVLAVASAATKYIEFAVVPANVVFGHSVAVIVQDDMAVFAILTSDIHKSWVREYASYNLSLIRYTPSDCLETFPFPAHMSGLRTIGQQYKDWRSEVMLRNDEGLTKTLNRLHSPGEHNAAIERLRRLQVELDQAVLNAYGFADCELGHGFHDTKQGIRFTISLAARQEILRRLLKLNHERYAAEVAAGLHEKSTKKNPKSKKSDDDIETDPNVQLGIRRHLFDDQLILGELYVE